MKNSKYSEIIKWKRNIMIDFYTNNVAENFLKTLFSTMHWEKIIKILDSIWFSFR